jgi:hypothetical protein
VLHDQSDVRRLASFRGLDTIFPETTNPLDQNLTEAFSLGVLIPRRALQHLNSQNLDHTWTKLGPKVFKLLDTSDTSLDPQKTFREFGPQLWSKFGPNITPVGWGTTPSQPKRVACRRISEIDLWLLDRKLPEPTAKKQTNPIVRLKVAPRGTHQQSRFGRGNLGKRTALRLLRDVIGPFDSLINHFQPRSTLSLGKVWPTFYASLAAGKSVYLTKPRSLSSGNFANSGLDFPRRRNRPGGSQPCFVAGSMEGLFIASLSARIPRCVELHFCWRLGQHKARSVTRDLPRPWFWRALPQTKMNSDLRRLACCPIT